ncbi:MAG: WYL domain-containing transcriptional regulator [Clostridia bacterium]|nr:WYL domain-containing transcriptional regulator [Clostridia bacterium]
MAKSPNQKLKLLYLVKFLMQHSDEDHPVSTAQIIDELKKNDISAERKSIYDDIEALCNFGVDIVQVKGRNGGYYIGERDFELPELKLLVDSVQSSKFITQDKTYKLIKKIESLASVYDGQLLQRQVYVSNRVKSMNESIYYTVDAISDAITQNKKIRYQYFEYTVTKERRFRHDGKFYEVSPFALIWDDENYYMLAWDSDAGKMKHYRVDKMFKVSITDNEREGIKEFEKVDMSAYTKSVFGMFGGNEQKVKLRFANHLVGAVLDRFGRDIIVIKDGDEHFTVSVNVVVSQQFLAWVFGFGDDVEIISPEDVRNEMKKQAEIIANKYN